MFNINKYYIHIWQQRGTKTHCLLFLNGPSDKNFTVKTLIFGMDLYVFEHFNSYLLHIIIFYFIVHSFKAL